MHFASLLSSEFNTMTVINPPEKEMANRISVHRSESGKTPVFAVGVLHSQRASTCCQRRVYTNSLVNATFGPGKKMC